MKLHPQMQQFVDQLATIGMPPDFAAIGAQQARVLSTARGAPGEGPPLPRVEDFHIDSREGPLAARLYCPDKPLALLVYFHGGGWVLGDIAGYDPCLRHFAKASECAILSVEYRLAPEYRHPAAVEDCIDATAWAAANLRALGLPKTLPLAVGGDSAGGNLAAVAAQIARDEGQPALAAQLLIYPVTDSNFATPSYNQHADQSPLTADAMRWFWDQYIADDNQLRSDPTVAPLQAADLSGLPQALVALAEFDPLYSEGEDYAARLQGSGCEVTLVDNAGLTHGFFQFSEVLPVAGQALEKIALEFKQMIVG